MLEERKREICSLFSNLGVWHLPVFLGGTFGADQRKTLVTPRSHSLENLSSRLVGSALVSGGKKLFNNGPCISSWASKHLLQVMFRSGPQLHPLLDPSHLIRRRPCLVIFFWKDVKVTQSIAFGDQDGSQARPPTRWF